MDTEKIKQILNKIFQLSKITTEKKNYKRIVTRYSETAPYIEKAFDIAEMYKKNVGLSIIPICTIDPYYWKYCNIGWKETSENMVYISPEEQNFGGLQLIFYLKRFPIR